MRTPAFLSAFALLFLACQTPGEPASGRTSQAIVGGVASPSAQDSTVLVSEGGYSICTGVLIAPNLVLTARHCVSDYNDQSECGGPMGQSAAATSLTVSVGPSASADGQVARGVRLFLPGADQLCGADLALLSLDNDVKGVTPSKVRFSALAVGEVTTAVGYGDNGTGREQRPDVGVLAVGPSRSAYRTAEGYEIPMSIPADEVMTTESTCFGDSGGPLFDSAGLVVGVASRGLDDRCRDRPTLWTTFAGHTKLIKDAATAAGHPIDDAAARTPTATSPAVNGVAPSETTDGETTPDGKPKPQKKSSAGVVPNGCTATHGSTSGTAIPLFALVALALVGRRRR